MKKSLVALAFGTLALGIAEFVMMAILPYVAGDLHVSIATAGHLISAYALGVCVGAPALIFARRLPLKRILLILVCLMIAGNLCAAVAPGYGVLMLARFVSGLPHGAYFGVGSIVAEKLADKGKGAEAVSIMIAGMTVANLFGVPLGTTLSEALSWRATFLLVGCWGLVVLLFVWRWVPQVGGLPDTGFKGQFRFFRKKAPWLLLGATLLGNGGVSQTVRAVLQDEGALEVLVASRRPLGGTIGYEEALLRKEVSIIVNATPVGMYPNGGTSPIRLSAFDNLSAAVDLIYNPLRTDFLQQAAEMGAVCADGLLMLVYQAKTAARSPVFYKVYLKAKK